MAAELGKRMLEENDELRLRFDQLQDDHEDSVKVSTN